MHTIRKLRKESQELRPSLQIGKAGVTDSVAAEITAQLKRKKLIKVKMLKNVLGRESHDSLAQSILERVPCLLVREVGNVLTLSYLPKAQDIKARPARKSP
ncbi:MAG: YhbY family RNA-binding protein [Nanoarchaeota archaeon]|nr:YhbY family RNA-binding protein [Nanoarchaeota archaeon]